MSFFAGGEQVEVTIEFSDCAIADFVNNNWNKKLLASPLGLHELDEDNCIVSDKALTAHEKLFLMITVLAHCGRQPTLTRFGKFWHVCFYTKHIRGRQHETYADGETIETLVKDLALQVSRTEIEAEVSAQEEARVNA